MSCSSNAALSDGSISYANHPFGTSLLSFTTPVVIASSLRGTPLLLILVILANNLSV